MKITKKMKKNAFKESIVLTALLISVIFFAIIMGLSSCQKKNIKGYRINNLGGVNLIVTTQEGIYTIETTKSLFFTTKGKPSYKFENESYKVKIHELGTHPEQHVNVLSYIYNFEVSVRNGANQFSQVDSVRISINGAYYYEPLPFFYGTDSEINSYRIISRPNIQDKIFTSVSINGNCVEVGQGDCIFNGN